MTIEYELEVYSDVFIIIYNDNTNVENDTVMVWRHGSEIKEKAEETILHHEKFRKPENKTGTITFEMDESLIKCTNKWCDERGITLEKLVYAYIEFLVQKENTAKVKEILSEYKEVGAL